MVNSLAKKLKNFIANILSKVAVGAVGPPWTGWKTTKVDYYAQSIPARSALVSRDNRAD